MLVGGGGMVAWGAALVALTVGSPIITLLIGRSAAGKGPSNRYSMLGRGCIASLVRSLQTIENAAVLMVR